MDNAIVAGLNPNSIAQMKITTNESIKDSKWETLPRDLLLKIQQKLDIRDQTRLYCVCKSWQSAMSKAYLPPVPFLFVPPQPQLEEGPFRLYDVVDSKSYDLKPTQGEFSHFLGSSYGWLVAVIGSGPRICLINPLTGLRKQLPDVTWETASITNKYILSSNPSLSDDFIVVVTTSSLLAYTRHGDGAWTNIQSKKFIFDIAFYEGELYGLTQNFEMMHIKIGSSGSQVTQISQVDDGVPPNYFYYTYLVESCIGLLRVERIGQPTLEHENALTENTTGIHVYKFDFEQGRWGDRLTDIGENVLFVGRICSVSISSRDIPRGDSNTIYFMDNSQATSSALHSRGCLHMGVFNLKTSTVKHSVATIEFVRPHVWPLPIWVTPPLISG